MSTLNITTSAYSGSNRIRIDLYKATAPNAIIDYGTAINSSTGIAYTKGPIAGPLPSTLWFFLDLIPGEVYIYKLVEIELATTNVLNTLITDNVTLSSGITDYKEPENIIVDTTPGVDAGATTATFDGVLGRPDFKGWEPIFWEEGTSALQKDVRYTWDKATGDFAWLNGEVFQSPVRYFTEFEPKINNTQTPPIIRDAWTENFYITDDVTLTAAQFGSNAIIKGADGYLKITLPNIFDVVPNRLLFIDSTEGNHKCAEIVCSSISGNSNLIMWPRAARSSLYVGPLETLAIYREKVDNSTSYWRVKFADGNFKTVGGMFLSALEGDDITNAVELDGSELDAFEYARLYNDVVLRQDPSNVVTYGSWSGADESRYKFSTKNSSDKFRIPDLRNVFIRTASAIRVPGVFQGMALQSFTVGAPIAPNGNTAGSLIYGRGGSSIGTLPLSYTGTETRPDNVSERLFILV